MTLLRTTLTLSTLTLLSLAACGGSTTSDVGTTGQAGQGQAGQGQAGQGQAGQGQAGQGQAGQGQAGQGQAGQGQAGQGQAGANNWSACAKPGECLVTPTDCCGSCGAATPANKDAINKAKLSERSAALCAGAGCPACFMEQSKDLLGVCRANNCEPIEISFDAMSACNADADCVLRTPGDCCNCGTATNKSAYVAVSQTGLAEYQANACPDVSGACACPEPPNAFKAVCGATKHCEVVPAAGVGTVCPFTQPGAGAPCPQVGLDCEYGENLIASCRSHATCQPSGWSIQAVKCQGTVPAGQNGCPSSVSASGSACDKKIEGQVCDMGGDATCLCSSCLGGPCSTTAKWGCASPPGGGCPSLAPNAGQPCKSEGLACNYGVICSSTGARKICTGGVWVADLIACAN